jgi:hypothetical protein
VPHKRSIPKAARALQAGADLPDMPLARAKQIAGLPQFSAWQRAMTVVDHIWREYSLLMDNAGKTGTTEVHTPAIIAQITDCQERLMKAIKVVLPYEKARKVMLQGDRENPLFDLSGLSDDELKFLRRTVLRASQVPEEED